MPQCHAAAARPLLSGLQEKEEEKEAISLLLFRSLYLRLKSIYYYDEAVACMSGSIHIYLALEGSSTPRAGSHNLSLVSSGTSSSSKEKEVNFV